MTRNSEMVMLVSVVAAVVFPLALRWHQTHRLLRQIGRKQQKLGEQLQRWFTVQPCFRCHEFVMQLLEISPNGRSIHYQCLHCRKKSHAPAATPDATRAIETWNDLCILLESYNARTRSEPLVDEMLFLAPAAPLPYEQTSRTPIPEAIRGEVWRRDRGQCVQCGSKQNLQFDHIVPVALGGATSVANLQLLCQPCNGSKGKRI